MPLFVNDHEVVLSNTEDPAVKFYLQHKDKIQEKTDFVCIRKYVANSKYLYDDSGSPLRPNIQTVPLKWSYRSKERGQETWVYAEERSKNKNERWTYKPTHLFVADELQLDPYGDVEKVFILTVIGDVGRCGCYVFDPIVEAKKKAAKMGGDELDVRFLIYKDPEVTDEDLVLIAQAWGVGDADKVDPIILRNKLYEYVTESEKRVEQTGRGYKQFVTDIRNIRSTNNKDKVIDRAIIQKAILDQVVRFEDKDRRWYYTVGGDYITQVPHDQLEKKADILLGHYQRHQNEFDSLKSEVWADKVKPEYSISDLDKLNTISELRAASKHMGVKLPINIKPENAKAILVKALSS